MFRKKKICIGLDIGSFSVKYVQLLTGGDIPVLTDFDVIRKMSLGEAEVLAQLARRLGPREVNISVSGPSLVVRYIEMPKMNDDELKSSIKFEASKYIPFDVNEVIMDTQILEELPHGRMKIALVAGKKDVISKRIDLVNQAGFSVRAVDCDSFALMNAYIKNSSDADADNTTIALINFGYRLTSINVLRKRNANFTRELQFGSESFTKALSESLNLSLETASTLLEHPEERYEEILEIVKPLITHMIEEIKLSLSYYEDQNGTTVNRVFLSGGPSSFKGLLDIFKEGIEANCDLWDPFKRITIGNNIELEKLKNLKSLLPVAVGLAVRG